MDTRRFRGLLVSALIVVLFIVVVWALLSLVKGILGTILSLVVLVVVALLIWRLVKSGFYSTRT